MNTALQKLEPGTEPDGRPVRGISFIKVNLPPYPFS